MVLNSYAGFASYAVSRGDWGLENPSKKCSCQPPAQRQNPSLGEKYHLTNSTKLRPTAVRSVRNISPAFTFPKRIGWNLFVCNLNYIKDQFVCSNAYCLDHCNDFHTCLSQRSITHHLKHCVEAMFHSSSQIRRHLCVGITWSFHVDFFCSFHSTNSAWMHHHQLARLLTSHNERLISMAPPNLSTSRTLISHEWEQQWACAESLTEVWLC